MSENSQKCPNCSESIPLEYSVCPFCGFGILEFELQKFSYVPSYKEVYSRLYSFLRSPLKTSKNQFTHANEVKAANHFMLIFSLFLSLRLFFTLSKMGLNYQTVFIIRLTEKISITLRMGFFLFIFCILILPWFIWLGYKILFTLGTWLITRLCGMLGADLSKEQTRTVFGYIIPPIAAGEFLGLLFTLIGPRGSIGDTSIDITTLYEQIFSFMESFYTSGVMIVFRFLMVIIWIVTVVYAILGIRTVGKMAWANATIGISFPMGLFIYFFYIMGI